MQDKTLKLRAYSEPAKSEAVQGAPAKDQEVAQKLQQVTAQLEDEKDKSLELLKTIVQLRESLKQEQVKTSDIVRKAAELEAKAKEAASSMTNELARKSAQLEDEKKRTAEQAKALEQLRESIKQEQARNADASNLPAKLEAKTKEVAALEAKVKEMSAVLGKIASMAAEGKLNGHG